MSPNFQGPPHEGAPRLQVSAKEEAKAHDQGHIDGRSLPETSREPALMVFGLFG